uniref:transient receptor potential cation channel subfamily A member 1 isoform X3 n=1 Tax=Ciona intestinalis TaxID=7719 RepID=UPI00089DCDA4|nr:transient receptor potential cation channel subfamily A member 1 isoform X3 [Ciona intestinalis]|eukprot:XP_018671663.1 transient receptor potential cation channel subfamily A member 1 isoform X3 [Ciona intestinalis]
MTTKQTKRPSSVSDHNNGDLLVHDNEAYEGSDNFPSLGANGGFPQGITQAHLAGKKWSHLARNKRFLARSASVRAGTPAASPHNGLDMENIAFWPNATDQEHLNHNLISYFTQLARSNNDNDEVDFDYIEDLLEKGASINCKDKHGQGILHEAARAWHTDIALFLLEKGANIDETDVFGRTPLHVASATDYAEMVELLVDKGANIEQRTFDEKQTPLHYAARNDADESLRSLIKLGADIEAKDYKLRTPLFVAAELDRSETARYLIDINADATVVDDSGQLCMTHMVTKMGPVAKQALDQFHRKDRANRKQYFYLNLLETGRKNRKISKKNQTDTPRQTTLAKTPLEVIVSFRQLELIQHPVIMRMIDIKWNKFGRRGAFQALFLNLLYILVWTILGVAVPWYNRYHYNLPDDWWLILFWVIGVLFTAYYIAYEVREIILSRRRFKKWKDWREKQIKRDMKFCHPKWPEEHKYLESETKYLDDLLPSYFSDFWNYFDWIVYFFQLIVLLLHIIDVSLTSTSRVDPCCSVTNFTVCIPTPCYMEARVNNLSLSAWFNRFFVVTILLLWLRLMKDTRAFRLFGPFIVMLGKIGWDLLRFLYLYLEFYIPYACGFWMVFGNLQTISSMSTVDQMLFSLFRITLVDEYQFNEMQTFDIVMAYIMVGTFLGVSAILCINLFIALLSDTFQRVYDNANANAVMQQAALLLTIEENLSNRARKKFIKYIDDKCSPEEQFYDDDLTVAQDDDLKKVTIKIKEQMDELLEHIHDNEKERNFEPLSARQPDNDDNGKEKSTKRRNVLEDFSSARSGKAAISGPKKNMKDVLGMVMASDEGGGSSGRKLGEMSSKLQQLQMTQRDQQQSMRSLVDDVREIKQLLQSIAPGNLNEFGSQTSGRVGSDGGGGIKQKSSLLHQVVSAVSGQGANMQSLSHTVESELISLPGSVPATSSDSHSGVRTTKVQIDPSQNKPTLGPGGKDETNV